MTVSKKIRTILGRNPDKSQNHYENRVKIGNPLILVQCAALYKYNYIFYLDLVFILVLTFVQVPAQIGSDLGETFIGFS